MNAHTEPMVVDVISDVVCPWCFIGKRQLEAAIERFGRQVPGAPRVEVRWHPFQLNPDMPAEGMARTDYLQRKFGSADGSAIYERVRKAAEANGLELALQDIARQPNTMRAHALIALSGPDVQPAMVERLFRAYFVEGADLTDDGVLIELAREAGLSEPAIDAALHDESVHGTVSAADENARRLGVSGVPFFIFDQKLGVSGAAGTDTLVQAFETALARSSQQDDEAPAA